MIPALQARALSRTRDYVSSEDVEALSPLIFGHRLELAPGSEGTEAVIKECLVSPLEKLARASMRRS
jgi:MoxR-like ATPase